MFELSMKLLDDEIARCEEVLATCKAEQARLKAARVEIEQLRTDNKRLRETIGWVLSSSDGMRLWGLDPERIKQSEAEIAAGNYVTLDQLADELREEAKRRAALEESPQ